MWLGAEEGLVGLDVDVDVGGVELGDGVDAVGAGGEVGGGEDGGPVHVARQRARTSSESVAMRTSSSWGQARAAS